MGDVLPGRHGADATGDTVHPTPIYETLAMGLGAFDPLAAARPVPRGDALRALPRLRGRWSASWSSSSGATADVALGLTAAQLESLAMMVAGVDLDLPW